MAKFQILSIIGGGIRGAFVTSLLSDMEQRLGRPIAECFDLIAGTSTGGIIAAGLAAGLSAGDMQRFYEDHGAKIFSPRPPFRPKGAMRVVFPFVNWVFQRKTGGNLDAAFRARFCPHQLKKAFDIAYGDRTLRDVTTTRLMIPTVNLTKGRPHVFRSPHLEQAIPDLDVRISDVVVAATAAPTYFPHKQIGDDAYIDGGVWSNDPSVLAVAESMRIKQTDSKDDDHDHPEGHVHIEDINLLAIGTGEADFSLAPPGDDAGLLYWAPRVAEVMGTAQTQGTHIPLGFILGDRCRHLNFKMSELWDLADVSKIPELFEEGKKSAAANYDELYEQFFQHQRIPFRPVA